MLKAKQKLLIWPEVRTRGETVVQDYGVETLNRDGQHYLYYAIYGSTQIQKKLKYIHSCMTRD